MRSRMRAGTVGWLATCVAAIAVVVAVAPAMGQVTDQQSTSQQSWDAMDTSRVAPDPAYAPGYAEPILAPLAERTYNDEFAAGLRADNCCGIGGWEVVFSRQNFNAGNVIEVTDDRTILNYSVELIIDNGVVEPLYFAIYRFQNTQYERVSEIRVLNAVGTGQREFYQSPTFNFPVSGTPEAPSFYGIAVNWGSEDILIARDSRGYPITACDGAIRVRGLWGYTNQQPPPADVLDFTSPFNQGALSMQLCFKPEPGACCFGSGCEMKADSLVCASSNGVFTAAGIQCSDINCPLPTGACCIDTSDCAENVNIYQCLDGFNGDAWHEGEDCDIPRPCPPFTGACCEYDGTCTNDVTETECLSGDPENNRYMGDYSTCSDPDVQCLATGACCLPNTCVQETSPTCSNLGGTFKGVGSHCQDAPNFPLDPCDAELGACCLYDGTCVGSVTEYQCEVENNGSWSGGGTACDAITCPVLGACCSSQGCTDTTSNGCLTGTWKEGQPCKYDPCSATVGACCLGGACEILNSFDCYAAGGVPEDVGTNAWDACSAASVPCDSLGACCTGDACELTTSANCTGDFFGEGTSCSEFLCLDGYCCLPGVGCRDDLRRYECLDLGGTPGPPNTTCADEGQLCQVGACCRERFGIPTCSERPQYECLQLDGNPTALGALTECQPDGCDIGACCTTFGCMEVTRIECEQVYSGTFEGAATTCEPGVCEATGACCVEGACQEITQTECADTNGLWLPFANDCSSSPCQEGSCCPANGTGCIDGVIRSQCPGSFTLGGTCSTNGIDTCAVACCTGGECRDLLPTECATSNGYSDRRDGRQCADKPDICDPGACCFGEADCGSANELLCETVGGSFLGVGTLCVSNACATLGACCSYDGDCQYMPKRQCEDQPCSHFTEGQTCATAGCTDYCGGITPTVCSNDADSDGDVDLDDFAAFQACTTQSSYDCMCIFDNASGVPSGPEQIIDDQDLTGFYNAITGPTAAPTP